MKREGKGKGTARGKERRVVSETSFKDNVFKIDRFSAIGKQYFNKI